MSKDAGRNLFEDDDSGEWDFISKSKPATYHDDDTINFLDDDDNDSSEDIDGDGQTRTDGCIASKDEDEVPLVTNMEEEPEDEEEDVPAIKNLEEEAKEVEEDVPCLLYTSPSPRDS